MWPSFLIWYQFYFLQKEDLARWRSLCLVNKTWKRIGYEVVGSFPWGWNRGLGLSISPVLFLLQRIHVTILNNFYFPRAVLKDRIWDLTFVGYEPRIPFRRFSDLQVVDLQNLYLDIQEIEYVMELSHLHTLFLMDCRTTDHIFRILELPTLSTLVLRRITFLKDWSATSYFSIPLGPTTHNLTHLDISDTILTEHQLGLLVQKAYKLKTLIALNCNLYLSDSFWDNLQLQCFIGKGYPFDIECLHRWKQNGEIQRCVITDYDLTKNTISIHNQTIQLLPNKEKK